MVYKKAEKIETNELCEYGCNNQAKYKTRSGKLICSKSPNSCSINKAKNSGGTKESAAKKNYKEIYNNLSEYTKEKMKWNKGNINADFSYNGKGSHKKVLILERGHQCEKCKLLKWLEQTITLELEHKDGDNKNNNKENLELLCPNCHSFTDTWRGRNINRTSDMYKTDEEFINAINESSNIRQALIKLGLTSKGANYNRPKKLIEQGLAKLKQIQ